MAKRTYILFIIFAFVVACKPNGIQSATKTQVNPQGIYTVSPVNASGTSQPQNPKETAAEITPAVVQMGELINNRTGFLHPGETHIYNFADGPSLGYDYFAFMLTSDDTSLKPVVSLNYAGKLIDENGSSTRGAENILPSTRLPAVDGKFYCIDPVVYPNQISVEIAIKDIEGTGSGNYTLKLISLSSVSDANDCTYIFGGNNSISGSENGNKPTPTPIRIVVQPFTFEESFLSTKFQSPDWSHSNQAWLVTGKVLFSYGEEGNEPGVYTVTHRIPVLFDAPDYLRFEFKGKLLTEGNPQPGRSIDVKLGGYDLHLETSIAGDISSKTAISFNLDDGSTVTQAILAPNKPKRDMYFVLRAIRSMGTWSFYVNKNMVGTAEDILKVSEFSELSVTTSGSTAINHVMISNQP